MIYRGDKIADFAKRHLASRPFTSSLETRSTPQVNLRTTQFRPQAARKVPRASPYRPESLPSSPPSSNIALSRLNKTAHKAKDHSEVLQDQSVEARCYTDESRVSCLVFIPPSSQSPFLPLYRLVANIDTFGTDQLQSYLSPYTASASPSPHLRQCPSPRFPLNSFDKSSNLPSPPPSILPLI